MTAFRKLEDIETELRALACSDTCCFANLAQVGDRVTRCNGSDLDKGGNNCLWRVLAETMVGTPVESSAAKQILKRVLELHYEWMATANVIMGRFDR